MINKVSLSMKEHYKGTIIEHGSCARGVDWRDEDTAEIRHGHMKNLMLFSNSDTTLLDVGCGYGAFLGYLKRKSISVNYSGIDLVKEMIGVAACEHPEASFIIGDFLDEKFKDNFDYLICNGILTQKLDASLLEMERYYKEVVKKMFSLSKIGCCFNMMSTRVNFFAPNLFYRHPSEVLTYCLSEITQNVRVDHSYGLYEFTVYLYK